MSDLQVWNLDVFDFFDALWDTGIREADAIITDPPYCSGGRGVYQRRQKTSSKYSKSMDVVLGDFDGDQLDQRVWTSWTEDWLRSGRRIVRPGGLCAAFIDWRNLPAMTDAFQRSGWMWQGILPWIKTQVRPRMGGYRQSAEFIVWGTNGPLAESKFHADGHILMSGVSNPKRIHPTQKPYEVMEWLVSAVPSGGTVVDPFCGAGSTLYAALDKGRRALGSDFDQQWTDRFEEVNSWREGVGDPAPKCEMCGEAVKDGGCARCGYPWSDTEDGT